MAHLEERLQEYEILDRHLKEENVLLKERIAKLDQQLADGKGMQAFLAKRVQKWYNKFQGDQCKVRVLKAKLAKTLRESRGSESLGFPIFLRKLQLQFLKFW